RAGTPRREALPKWGGTVDLGVFVQRVASPELRVFEEQVLEIAKVLAIGDSGSRDRVLRMREHVKDVKASAAEADEAHSRPINNTKAVYMVDRTLDVLHRSLGFARRKHVVQLANVVHQRHNDVMP